MNAVRYENIFNLGHILTVLAVVVPALVVYGARNERTDANQETLKATQAAMQSTKVELTAEIVAAKAEMATQISGVQTQNNEQFRNVRNDIANLPDMRATVTQVERRMNEMDSRADAQSKRQELNDRMAIETRAKVDALVNDVQRLGNVLSKMQDGGRAR